ncbi:MAG: hypothetical protein HY319_05165 [Armatimonadetes bacterium]|nr:hypothetical protein [Armatimonadota bacterium]
MTAAVHYEKREGQAILVPPAPRLERGRARFPWSRGGSYAWVTRPTGGVEAPFLEQVEPPSEDYFPSEKLHHEFARLPNRSAEELLPALKEFSETHGPLGVAELIPPDKRLAKWGAIIPAARKFAQPSLGEPFGMWWKEAREIRNALGLASLLEKGGRRLEDLVRWGELQYHADGATVVGDRLQAFVCVQIHAFKKTGRTFRLDEADCDAVGAPFPRRDAVLASLTYLSQRIDRALDQWVEVRTELGSETERRLSLHRRPRNLLGFLWLSLAEELEARLPTFRACRRCGLLFPARGRSQNCPSCRR